MGTTAEKLTYLNTTKGKIKDGINNLGGNITSETTFRQYATELDNIYSKLPKVSGSGTSLSLTPTLKGKITSTLKGNTSQTGTPTPSSPIPVNVVSGDNYIVVCGKNLFNKNDITTGLYYYDSGTGTSDNWAIAQVPVKPNTSYYLSGNIHNNTTAKIVLLDSSKNIISDLGGYSTVHTITTTSSTAYIGLSIAKYTGDTDLDIMQLEVGNQATTYEAYNGTTYNIDLPVENLFDKDNANILDATISSSTKKIENSSQYKCLYIPCLPNTTYTIQKIQSGYLTCGFTATIPSNDVDVDEYTNFGAITTLCTITSLSTSRYLVMRYYRTTDTLTESEIRATIQIEYGSKPNTYTPYGTTPIELNKIGTYQDYIYKENDKWYLHKETGKLIINGTENPTLNTSSTNTTRVLYSGVLNQANKTDRLILCNYLKEKSNYSNDIEGAYYSTSNGDYWFRINKSTIGTTTSDVNTWLSNHNVINYFALETPTNTEITYTPLIEQLDELENAKSKEGTTNINQVNNDLGFIIDASALKGNEA